MNKLVYSTSTGSHKKSKDPANQKSSKSSFPGTTEGPLKIRLEKKGRGGKAVTVLFNLSMSTDEAKELKKELSSKLGVGSSIKNGTIEFQGNQINLIEKYLSEQNIKYKISGART